MERLKKNDEEGVFFGEKERLHLFISLPYENGKAQIMPVLSGRLSVNSRTKCG